MRVCAIDVHHHYLPESLLDQARRGKSAGVKAKETKPGETAISFAGGSSFNVPQELAGLKERFEAMDRGKIAIGALIPVFPFFFWQGSFAIMMAFGIAMLSHWLVGAARSVFTGRSVFRSGLDMFVVGLGVAVTGYFVGEWISRRLA